MELPELKIPPEGIELDKVLATIHSSYVFAALKLANWNKTNAAKLLHLNRTTLQMRLKAMGYNPKEK